MTRAVSKPTRIWKGAVAKRNPSLICCWSLATVPFACLTLFWKIANSQQKHRLMFKFLILISIMSMYTYNSLFKYSSISSVRRYGGEKIKSYVNSVSIYVTLVLFHKI